MPKVPQGSFARGELSPRMYGRDDTQLYYAGLKHCLNFVVTQTASLQRRPGTVTVAQTRSGEAWLYAFNFSDQQAYIIEAGDQYFRYFSEDVPVFDGGAVVETATPYLANEFKELTTAQSTDTMYIVHPNHPPYVLRRTSATSFFLAPVQFDNPPMGPLNSDSGAEMTITGQTFIANQGQVTASAGVPALSFGDTILVESGGETLALTVTDAGSPPTTNYTGSTPIGTTGNFSVNGTTYPGETISIAGGTTGGVSTMTASGHAPFTPADVGRSYRIRSGETWYTFEVTNYLSPTQVQTNYVGPTISTGTTEWAAGAFYEGNYPTAVSFYGSSDRLAFANTPENPQAVWMSEPGNYLSFAQTDPDGSTNDDNGILAILNDYEVNPIYWLRPSGSDLLAGTSSGVYRVGPGESSVVAPSTISAQFQGATGTADLEPIRARGQYVYVQSKGRKLTNLVPPEQYWARYTSSELSITAQHLPECGVRDMAYQEEPYSIIWVVTASGELIACTYVPEQQMTAWHRHRIDGYHEDDVPTKVESVQVIPSPRGDTNTLLPNSDYDQLWMVVNRGGVRSVERLQEFEGFGCTTEVTYLDGSGTYDVQYQSYAELLDPNYDMGGQSRGNKGRTPEVWLHFHNSVLQGATASGSQYGVRHEAEWRDCEDPDKSNDTPQSGILNIHNESGYSRQPHFSFETDEPVHVEILKLDTDRSSGRA